MRDPLNPTGRTLEEIESLPGSQTSVQILERLEKARRKLEHEARIAAEVERIDALLAARQARISAPPPPAPPSNEPALMPVPLMFAPPPVSSRRGVMDRSPRALIAGVVGALAFAAAIAMTGKRAEPVAITAAQAAPVAIAAPTPVFATVEKPAEPAPAPVPALTRAPEIARKAADPRLAKSRPVARPSAPPVAAPPPTVEPVPELAPPARVEAPTPAEPAPGPGAAEIDSAKRTVELLREQLGS